MKTLFYLFVDDERGFPQKRFETFKGKFKDVPVVSAYAPSYQSAIENIQRATREGYSIFVDLDHDLGLGKTGYDICKFIVENQLPIIGYHLHTMNPVGMQNMKQLLSHYGYTAFWLD